MQNGSIIVDKKTLMSVLILCGILLNGIVSGLTIYPNAHFYGGYLDITFQDSTTFSYFALGDQYVVFDALNLSVSGINDVMMLNISKINSGINLSSGTTVLRFNATYTGSSATFVLTGNHSNSRYNVQVDGNIYSDSDSANRISFTINSWSDHDINILLDGYAPDPPYNSSSTYYNSTNYDNLTWDRGNYSDREILVGKTGSYPSSPSDGTVWQNSTIQYYNFSVNETQYFTAWSYNDSTGFYSNTGLNFVWGALGVSVYNESNMSQAITNWSVLIKNKEGTEGYEEHDLNNILYLDVTDVPNGDDCSLKTWADGYQARTQTMDLPENAFINISFYLPMEEFPAGGQGGDSEGQGGHVNESYEPEIYYIRVVETYETDYGVFDRPVQDAKMTFQRYNKQQDVFVNVSSLLTDANGYINLYLIPSVSYQVIVEKQGYDRMISDYTPPPPNDFGQVPEKWFRINSNYEEIINETTPYTVWTNITWSVEPTQHRWHTNFTIYFNITSSDSMLEWYSMEIKYLNFTNNTWVSLSFQNESNPEGGTISYTLPNITGQYSAAIYFKKTGFNIIQLSELSDFGYAIFQGITALQGVPDFVFYLVIIIISMLIMGFLTYYLGPNLIIGYVGLLIMSMAMLIRPFSILVNSTLPPISGWVVIGVTFLLYTGAIYLWSKI